ncbi:phosphoglycerate dehydrogenase [Thiocystis violascens]|uniref:Phosphoglycerate dehydrogenase-like oxidoreductase n=1 Tax=Thiocystis violascens (strain ATCC 17096 / DSM 198 / 6111) TaxID=765911 RepID=I3YAQ5_THIV6|nr:phosphoglycerate dehydrogenase [Thiocystis violascens]AFL74073.1 phosphoglycerate dehydrogenase-like oxidoreductase [Thiocystis violascens DSM 198]
MFKIQTLNNISVAGLERLPRDRYEVASEIAHPDAILVRSAKMHDMEIPVTVKAIGRAGAGTNNVPVAAMTARGVAVFNAPGANANAVKELVIAGMLIAARNIAQAWQFARGLEGDDAAINQAVESGKKQFGGFELPGRTLGVVGLGAIGVKVANAARALGMKVVGYDPTITVHRAWQLASDVQPALSIDDLLSRSDFVTFHVPLTDETRHMINAERIRTLPKGAVLLNFSREGILDDAAVVAALDQGHLYAYCCDFPSNLLKNHPRVVTLPHLGASTREAEDNCAIMVADQIREYLENGNVTNSVNFPEICLPLNGGPRLAIVNSNVPNMVGQISTDLANAGLNILDMLNRSRGDVAVTLIDIDKPCPEDTLAQLRSISGVLSVRHLGG